MDRQVEQAGRQTEPVDWIGRREPVKVTAAILAGGKSSRMGRDKALLPLGGGTMLSRACRMFEQVYKRRQKRNAEEAGAKNYEKIILSPVLLISDQMDGNIENRLRRETGLPEMEQMELQFVRDVQCGYGPVEGIYQLLKNAKTEWVFVLATDMPGVSPELIEFMLEQLCGSTAQALVAIEARVHPLCGLYNRICLSALEMMRQENCHRLMELCSRVETCYIDIRAGGFSACELDNINTEKEYESCNYNIE